MTKIERRYWTFVVLWTAILYATLPIARKLANKIEGAGYKCVLNYGPIFLVAIAFVAALVYILNGRYSHRLLRISCMVIAAFLYALFLKNLGKIPIERIHLMEYGILAILAKKASENRLGNLGSYLFSAVLTAMIGVGDELIQKFLPDRVCDIRDMMTNAISGALGLLFWACVSQKPSDNSPSS